MGLNDTPGGERVRIGFFGMRNAGKSSVVNAFTGQDLSVVSDVRGTTTDAVRKSMELLPMGPVTIIDTPGMDDEGELGERRVARARRELASCDVAVLVVDGTKGLSALDGTLIEDFAQRQVPYVVAWNKCDLPESRELLEWLFSADEGLKAKAVAVSGLTGEGIEELKERVGHLAKAGIDAAARRIVVDLVPSGSVVVLVTPIDSAAPKGRLILPQQQVLRELLDFGCIPVVCRETELEGALAALREPPALVVTDSQAFGPVSHIVPEDVPLTSFSILFVRYKADLVGAVRGVSALMRLSDGDRVLVSEGCTHHRQCGDIGTVKLPKWIAKLSGAHDLDFSFTSGVEFPEDPSSYKAVVHCGGCMLNAREMRSRQARSLAAGVPWTNYGVTIAAATGVLRRSLTPFPEALSALDEG